MCSLGALRAGAGLVELFVLEEIYEIIAAAAAPEVMVKAGEILCRSSRRANRRLGRRPGSRENAGRKILELILKAKQPMVVDADGSQHPRRENGHVAKGARDRGLLTPHPAK